jgi:N-acetylglutamate synthase-like GNAT family acetyltransferase
MERTNSNAAPEQQLSVSIEDFMAEDAGNEEDVNKIIRLSSRESMVSISLDSIAKHAFSKAAYIGGADSSMPERELAGYGAITHLYSSSVLELGGLVVSEKFRKSGIASMLIKSIVADTKKTMDPELIIAFTNPTSSSIFARLGGSQIEDARSLPPEVWKVCHVCRFYDDAVAKGDNCCGRVYDITDILPSTGT